MTFNDFASKKVLGVPVLYLIGGAVVILAVVAWKMPSKSTVEDTPADAGGPDENAADDPYDDFETKGTVIVQPVQPTPDPNLSNSSIPDNETWIRKGIEYLTQKKDVPGSDASNALNKFFSGQDMSYDEKSHVDAVFAEFGPPPDGGGGGGSVGTKPLTKQFTTFPGTHVIQGGADNSFGALASLYYNSNANDRIDLLQAANTSLGANGPWPTGTKVKIPAYTVPKMYKVSASGGERADAIAKKNGITLVQLGRMNNVNETSVTPTKLYPKGSNLRVG